MWHTTGEQQPVQWSLLSAPPRNLRSAGGLWAWGILSSSDWLYLVEQARYHVSPGEWPVGRKPQLADRPDIGPEHLGNGSWLQLLGRGLNSCHHSGNQLTFFQVGTYPHASIVMVNVNPFPGFSCFQGRIMAGCSEDKRSSSPLSQFHAPGILPLLGRGAGPGSPEVLAPPP